VDLKLPLQDAAKHCYTEVERMEILGPAVAAMTRQARDGAPFSRRLDEIVRIRREAVGAFREWAAGVPKDREESIFVCAADDLLEAAFLREVEQARAKPPEERTSRLEFVSGAVLGLSLNPSWDTYARKRILDAVKRASTTK
jgi:hypothetical protein